MALKLKKDKKKKTLIVLAPSGSCDQYLYTHYHLLAFPSARSNSAFTTGMKALPRNTSMSYSKHRGAHADNDGLIDVMALIGANAGSPYHTGAANPSVESSVPSISSPSASHTASDGNSPSLQLNSSAPKFFISSSMETSTLSPDAPAVQDANTLLGRRPADQTSPSAQKTERSGTRLSPSPGAAFTAPTTPSGISPLSHSEESHAHADTTQETSSEPIVSDTHDSDNTTNNNTSSRRSVAPSESPGESAVSRSLPLDSTQESVRDRGQDTHKVNKLFYVIQQKDKLIHDLTHNLVQSNEAADRYQEALLHLQQKSRCEQLHPDGATVNRQVNPSSPSSRPPVNSNGYGAESSVNQLFCMQMEMKGQEERIASLERLVQRLRQRLDQAKTEAKHRESVIEVLQQEMNDALLKWESVVADLRQSERVVAEQKIQLKEKTELLSWWSRRYKEGEEDWKQRLHAVESRHEAEWSAIQQEVAQLADDVEGASVAKAEQQSNSSSLHQQLEQTRMRCAQLQKELVEVKQLRSKELSLFEEARYAEKEEKTILCAQMEQREAEHHHLLQRLETIISSKEQAEKEAKTATATLEASASALQSVEKALKRKEKEMRELQDAEQQRLRDALDAEEEKQEHLLSRVEYCVRSGEEMNRIVALAETRRKKAEEKLSLVTAECETLRHHLREQAANTARDILDQHQWTANLMGKLHGQLQHVTGLLEKETAKGLHLQSLVTALQHSSQEQGRRLGLLQEEALKAREECKQSLSEQLSLTSKHKKLAAKVAMSDAAKQNVTRNLRRWKCKLWEVNKLWMMWREISKDNGPCGTDVVARQAQWSKSSRETQNAIRSALMSVRKYRRNIQSRHTLSSPLRSKRWIPSSICTASGSSTSDTEHEENGQAADAMSRQSVPSASELSELVTAVDLSLQQLTETGPRLLDALRQTRSKLREEKREARRLVSERDALRNELQLMASRKEQQTTPAEIRDANEGGDGKREYARGKKDCVQSCASIILSVLNTIPQCMAVGVQELSMFLRRQEEHACRTQQEKMLSASCVSQDVLLGSQTPGAVDPAWQASAVVQQECDDVVKTLLGLEGGWRELTAAVSLTAASGAKKAARAEGGSADATNEFHLVRGFLKHLHHLLQHFTWSPTQVSELRHYSSQLVAKGLLSSRGLKSVTEYSKVLPSIPFPSFLNGFGEECTTDHSPSMPREFSSFGAAYSRCVMRTAMRQEKLQSQ